MEGGERALMMGETHQHHIQITTDFKPLSSADKRNIYRRLYQAALNGSWEQIENEFGEEIRHSTVITKRDETVLHIAVAAGNVKFVEQLVKRMGYADLSVRNNAGNTAFCLAAASGMVEMAEAMKKEDERQNAALAMVRGRNNELPLLIASAQGHRNMARYLYGLTKELLKQKINEYDEREIFVTLIHACIYDVAWSMIEKDRKLATARNRREETALHVLAQKSCLSAHPEHSHENATELVQTIWKEILRKDDEEIARLIETPWRLIFVAAEKGNVEFLGILIRSYLDLIFKVDVNGYTIFHVAVKHRQEKIFQLIHEFGSIKNLITSYRDEGCNNMLHLAAMLPCTASRLHVMPGPALQLQRELLWFEEVKKVVQVLPLLEAENRDNLTPQVLFIKSHEELIKRGEEWMRGTADKCMLVATLIATVVFAAAFTVPGGKRQGVGVPIFAASDALSLLSSVASVLSFLGIITSRYQLYDFCWSLPNKLIIGLATLFVSIVAMLVAFATMLFLVFNDGNRLIWLVIPIAAAACAPVIVFGWMHWSLLKEMIKQTYMSKSIFRPNEQPLSPVPEVAIIKSD